MAVSIEHLQINPFRYVWSEEWKIGKRIKNLIFPRVCIWLEGWKSKRDEKLFYLIEEESRRIKNVIFINLL